MEEQGQAGERAGNVHSKQKKEAGSVRPRAALLDILSSPCVYPPPSLPRSLARFQIEYRKASVRKKESVGRVRRQMNRVLMGYGGTSGCTQLLVGELECGACRKKPLQTDLLARPSAPVSLNRLAACWAVVSIFSITRMNTNGDA